MPSCLGQPHMSSIFEHFNFIVKWILLVCFGIYDLFRLKLFSCSFSFWFTTHSVGICSMTADEAACTWFGWSQTGGQMDACFSIIGSIFVNFMPNSPHFTFGLHWKLIQCSIQSILSQSAYDIHSPSQFADLQKIHGKVFQHHAQLTSSPFDEISWWRQKGTFEKW